MIKTAADTFTGTAPPGKTMKIVNVEWEHVPIVEKLLRQEKLGQVATP